jgi:transcriptional regulator with XRE-family HTH domain
MNDPKILLGQRVRELRSKMGVSQERLAVMAHIHRTYMGSVERGEKNISLESLVRIAHALGVRPEKLLSKIP